MNKIRNRKTPRNTLKTCCRLCAVKTTYLLWRFKMYLKTKEVANELGVCVSSVHRLAKEGIIPRPVRAGQRAVRWLKNEIEEYVSIRNSSRVA